MIAGMTGDDLKCQLVRTFSTSRLIFFVVDAMLNTEIIFESSVVLDEFFDQQCVVE